MGSKSYFNQVASDWDQMRAGFFPVSVREKAIEQIDIKAGMTIADIGAGTGFITEGLLNHPVQIMAVDESEIMLDTMRQKFAGQERIHYLLSESEALKLADHSVDHALANMYLHHVERPSAAIAELYRILKPGGKLVITDLDEHNHEFLRMEHHDRWMGFKRDDIRAWFKQAGFSTIEVDCVNANCCSSSSSGTESAKIDIFIAVGVK